MCWHPISEGMHSMIMPATPENKIFLYIYIYIYIYMGEKKEGDTDY